MLHVNLDLITLKSNLNLLCDISYLFSGLKLYVEDVTRNQRATLYF